MGSVLISTIFGLRLFSPAAYAAIMPWRRQARQGPGRLPRRLLAVKDWVAKLETQAESSYAALADLEFDRKVDKLNDDYERVRGQLMAETVELLRKLDSDTDVESQIEAVVSSRRAQQSKSAPADYGRSGTSCPACGTQARAGDHYCARCAAELGPTCPTCGAAVKSGDVFCVRCGSTLAVGTATA